MILSMCGMVHAWAMGFYYYNTALPPLAPPTPTTLVPPPPSLLRSNANRVQVNDKTHQKHNLPDMLPSVDEFRPGNKAWLGFGVESESNVEGA